MDLALANQVAVVIGGAQGIGRAIGEAFAREGAAVALVDLDPAVVKTAEEIATAFSRRVMGMVADAAEYVAMQRVEAEMDSALGRCDHVIYAAGAGSGKYGFPFWNLEPADWERVWRVNLLGAVNAAHAFGARLARGKSGTLLFISSVAGQIGSQTDPPYSAAKAALINFAQCAAKDLAPLGVRVNTICPGMVRTALNRSVWQAWHEREPAGTRRSYEEWAVEKIRRVVPLGRWQEPEDVAGLAVFLASPRAKNITGQTLNVDGGQVMRS
jgi:2-hydroxycyclohexanecarboxyl-CoA dehydrogenase